MYTRALLALLSAMSLASADTLVLRNGSRIDGTFMGGDSRSIRFAAGNQVNTYAVGDVESVRFVDDSETSSSQNPPGPVQAQAPPPASPYPPVAPAVPPAAAPPPADTGGGPIGVELPAGTNIVIRLIDPVDSDIDHLGQSYRASVDQPVVVDGQTVIPRGADLVAVLTNAQKAGKLEGKTALTIDLQSLTVDGRKYDIQTGSVTQASTSQTERSAKVIGGTAALGAIIGAIAGGGKGAAIGTLAGAGAGTAAQVATSGSHVKIPSETRLTFSLTHPLDL